MIRIKQQYGSRWFGADLQYLHLHPPKKEFFPFYLASGQVEGVYTGRVTYTTSSTTTTSSTGNNSNNTAQSGSETEVVYTRPQTLRTTFSENRTQVYGGFKYHMGHVHSVLRSEKTPLRMEPMPFINTTDATINLFEQSYFAARDSIEALVKEQAMELARERVKSFHPMASSIEIEFESLRIRTEALTPVFLPCYVVKALYDGVRYTIYVSGRSGAVGGPYLINALRVARVSSAAVLGLSLVLIPNKLIALWYGLWMAVPAYALAFFSGKFYPVWRRNRNRQQREAKRLANEVADEERQTREKINAIRSTSEKDFGDTESFSFNHRPNRDTRRQRIREAYQSSTYWDTHEFEKRQRASADAYGTHPAKELEHSFIRRWAKDFFKGFPSSTTSAGERTSMGSSSSSSAERRSEKERKRKGYFYRFMSGSESDDGHGSGSRQTSATGKNTKASRSFFSPSYPADPKGYYRLLGLRGDESINEVRSAYRKVVLQHHPDAGGSTEKMVNVNAAYRVLRDPSRRAAYDLET